MPTTQQPGGATGAPAPDLSHIAEQLRPLAVPCSDLTLDPANARRHPEANLEAIKGSLAVYGQVKPVVARADNGVVIAGNGTLEAARQLGWAHPAVVRVEMDAATAVGYAIADNRTAELAGWDADALDRLLREVSTGYDERLDAMLAELAEEVGVASPDGGGGGISADDPGPQVDRAKELQAKWGTALGQLWIIPSRVTPDREHRLLCGDSTKAEDVAQVMTGEKAALCATDPPYLVDYTGERPDHSGGNDGGKDWSAHYREVDIQDASAFFRAVFANVLDVLAPRAAIYCWHVHKRCGEIQQVWAELGILDHQQLVWVKPTPVFGRVFWHFRHEPCMMGWRKGSVPEHDGDQTLNSVWEIDWEGKAKVVGNDHPTQKPVEIFARPIRKHTRPGDVVFEPFSGSGSQCVAAEQTGRLCYGVELSPAFIAVALERLAGMGLEPRLNAEA
jgi:DNA modification methylase